jgi:hypothetical protein
MLKKARFRYIYNLMYTHTLYDKVIRDKARRIIHAYDLPTLTNLNMLKLQGQNTIQYKQMVDDKRARPEHVTHQRSR